MGSEVFSLLQLGNGIWEVLFQTWLLNCNLARSSESPHGKVLVKNVNILVV